MERQALKAFLGFLMVLFQSFNVHCICPVKCLCFGSSRHADCSEGNLSTLPHGLQDNITYLNLSHNQFFSLDYQLTRFTNVRTLDISYNLLRNIPSNLPKSLWELRATNNHIRVLHKHDTAHQWNLKLLDISENRLERAVLINNTLSSLTLLNLSYNHLWTVPTNIPQSVEAVDLSHNFLTQILPATLVRLPYLERLYLHSNRFTHIPNGSFDQLTQLKLITLFHNPWSCNERQSVTYLLQWAMKTSARVIGYPCPNQTFTGWDITVLTTSGAPEERDTLVSSRLEEGTTRYHSLPDEAATSTELYEQFQSQGATSSKASIITSTENPLLEEDGSAVVNSAYGVTAPEPDHIKDVDIIDLNYPLEKQLSTVITATTVSGKPTNIPNMSQSTAVILVKKEPASKVLRNRTPNSASCNHRFVFTLLLFNALILFTL